MENNKGKVKSFRLPADVCVMLEQIRVSSPYELTERSIVERAIRLLYDVEIKQPEVTS